MMKCPNCGADLTFSTKDQHVKCKYCDSVFDPKKLKNKINYSDEKSFQGKSFLCSQCGAKLLTFDETAITFCSYCGSQAMIESKMMKLNNPDFIIPFKKTKEDCIKAYKKKISKSWFVPNYMKSDSVIDKFRGIYIPYCVYTLSSKGKNSNKGKKYRGRSGDYIYYDDYSITADIDAEYKGISYDLLSNFYDMFSHSIPHNFKEAEAFNPNYLVGFYADAMDVDSSLYEAKAEGIVEEDSINQMLHFKEYRNYGCTSPKVDFTVTEKSVGMFPVYFLAIRHKNNNSVSYAVVNGQTGKVAIDLPIDFKKYILISLLITIPIFFLLNTFLVIQPKTICIFSSIISIISLIISKSQAKKINIRENHINDLGVVKIKGKKRKKSKGNSNFKFYLSILIGIIVLILNPVNDIYYYGASCIMFLFIIWSFFDLVKCHNLLTSNKLPQLEKRGGE